MGRGKGHKEEKELDSLHPSITLILAKQRTEYAAEKSSNLAVGYVYMCSSYKHFGSTYLV